ncbi:hypothetical protein AIS11_05175 [Salmonella enterica]|uniref:hypothetical protein n=1 Tax=Salmonella enterica TaxID=28901 RepID=UPI000DECB66F|nr:hypothetical protein [Salmonella enterica]EDN4774326.1 hypothetical protein [Salmonella enterica subsp. enterica serovar Gafsa]EEH9713253.1 hypothetical protein [Salmonella enterica subsp. enterica serovar Vancouver]MIG81334.1 hypothetical protein [Salmonella enterica subsp. enterica]AXD50730.1 hypothetical protein CHD13_00455 [Salmonella enterica]EBC3696944.1 hypothetical protein [Salmonella enterica]
MLLPTEDELQIILDWLQDNSDGGVTVAGINRTESGDTEPLRDDIRRFHRLLYYLLPPEARHQQR